MKAIKKSAASLMLAACILAGLFTGAAAQALIKRLKTLENSGPLMAVRCFASDDRLLFVCLQHTRFPVI